jgi:uncharacterized membrane protein/DNA-directed RNA polymerase subunit RPC12/RpoP
MRGKLLVTIGVILLLVSVCFSFGATAQIEPGDNFDCFRDEGDYIEMSFWSDEDDMDISGYMRMELKCDETVRVHGESYDCHVLSVKGSGEFDSGIGPKGNWEISGKQYSDKSDGSAVKSELLMKMTMSYQGETYRMTSDTTTERLSWSTNWTSDVDPDIGDCWKETDQEKTISRTTSETPEGDETYTDTTTDMDVTCYMYVGDENVNSKIGNIECKMIQSYDEDDLYYKDEDYVVSYMDKDLNLPVKSEVYENGDPVLTMETVAYKIGSDKAGTEVIGPIGGEEDRGLFGLGKIFGIDISLILLIVVLVTIVLIIAVFMMRRGHGEPETSPGGQWSGQQPLTPPPPPQPPYLQSPRQQPAPSLMATYNCPHCRNPFSAQPSTQAKQVSCPSCSGLVTINPQQPRIQAPKPSPAPPEQSPKLRTRKQTQKPAQQTRATAPKLIPLPLKQPVEEPPAEQPPQEEPQPEQLALEPPAEQPPQEEPQPEQPAQEPPAEQPPKEEPQQEQPAQELSAEQPPQEEPQPEQPAQELEQQPKEQPAQTQPAQPPKQSKMVRESPMDVLKMRLAKGEIDLETYREMKKELE